MAEPITLRVGDYVRFNGGRSIQRVARVWTIDRGPDKGRVKAHAFDFCRTPTYVGWGASTIAAAELFEPFPYAGPEIPLPRVGS
jgi:hypothetical protein